MINGGLKMAELKISIGTPETIATGIDLAGSISGATQVMGFIETGPGQRTALAIAGGKYVICHDGVESSAPKEVVDYLTKKFKTSRYWPIYLPATERWLMPAYQKLAAAAGKSLSEYVRTVLTAHAKKGK